MTYRKYHNTKTAIDGRVFDSRKEARRYAELKMLERAKLISGLECQREFVLIPAQRDPITHKVIERKCSYIADFVYYEDGEMIVEDTKGVKTPEYIIKRKLMLHVYGIRVREV